MWAELSTWDKARCGPLIGSQGARGRSSLSTITAENVRLLSCPNLHPERTEKHYKIGGTHGGSTVIRNLTPRRLIRSLPTFRRNCLRSAACLLGLFFDPEDGHSMFLRSVSKLVQTTRRHIAQRSVLRKKKFLCYLCLLAIRDTKRSFTFIVLEGF
jgi:hypothetical protein